jgi:hypothetical protein
MTERNWLWEKTAEETQRKSDDDGSDVGFDGMDMDVDMDLERKDLDNKRLIMKNHRRASHDPDVVYYINTRRGSR